MKNSRNMYESIMKDVNKIIKRHISEAEEAKTDVEIAADAFVADVKKNEFSLDTAINILKIVSKGQEKKITYKDVSYDKLIPELESRLDKRSVNDNYKIKRRR